MESPRDKKIKTNETCHQKIYVGTRSASSPMTFTKRRTALDRVPDTLFISARTTK